jgi:hypothetical protein
VVEGGPQALPSGTRSTGNAARPPLWISNFGRVWAMPEDCRASRHAGLSPCRSDPCRGR